MSLSENLKSQICRAINIDREKFNSSIVNVLQDLES